jgi:hypothetical protein
VIGALTRYPGRVTDTLTTFYTQPERPELILVGQFYRTLALSLRPISARRPCIKQAETAWGRLKALRGRMVEIENGVKEFEELLGGLDLYNQLI